MTRFPEFDVNGQIVDQDIVVTDDTRSVVVGPTEKGPAFVPTAVGSQGSLDRIFGSGFQTTYAASEQIREGGVPRVMRILETRPWNPGALFIGLEDPGQSLQGDLYEFNGTPDFVVAAVIAVDREDVADAYAVGTYDDFDIVLENASGLELDSVSVSMDPGSPRYFAEILPEALDGVNVHANFIDTQVLLEGEDVFSRYTDSGSLDFSDVGPDRATTPWVLSQDDVTGGRQRLFRFHALSEGENRNVKISIANIRQNSFDVLVRDFTDSDLNPEVLEEYEGVNLDRGSEDFIARRIGNDTEFYEDGRLVQSGGQYELQSDLVRVEMAGQVIPDAAYPYGFEGYEEPAERPQDVAIPEMPVVEDRQGIESEVLGSRRRNTYLGTNISNLQSLGFFNPIPSGTRKQDDYYLEPVLGQELSDSTVTERRFTIGFQGGYEGSDPYKDRKFGDNVTPENVQGLDCSSYEASGVAAYEEAFSFIRAPESTEMAHLSTPGVLASDHKPVVDEARLLCNNREDCVYTFQVAHANEPVADIVDVKDAVSGGSFVAAYHTWFDNNADWLIPLGDLVSAVYAQNDNAATPAKAPAGRNRGRIPSVAVEEVFTDSEQRQLHDNNINFATTRRGFIAVVGQHTLRPQGPFSQLNVRRGVNFIKLEAQSAARDLLFEPNTTQNQQELENAIETALEPLSQQGGVGEFEVNVTGQRNEMEGSIVLSFQDVIDRIIIDFSVRRNQIVFV